MCAYSVFNTFPVYPLSAKPLILLAFCRYRYHTSLFKDPEIFERPGNTARLSRVFYCDPMSSWQKGKLEKNHEFIRYILPKGVSFARLNQNKVTQIANHINSVARASLNGCTPFKLAQLLIDRKLLELCSLEDVPTDQVILKPTLLKH